MSETEEIEDKELEQEEDLDTLLRRINDERDGVALKEELFKIKSDIGKDDYRAFVYHSVFFKHPWLLPMYILAPPAISFSFGFFGGGIDLLWTVIFVAVMYVLILGITVFRTERGLSQRNQENPNLMKLTPTTFTFYANVIVNEKKSGKVRVPYNMLTKACETGKRFILYFDNKKAMIIRKEDVVRDADMEKFRSFINEKAKKK